MVFFVLLTRNSIVFVLCSRHVIKNAQDMHVTSTVNNTNYVCRSDVGWYQTTCRRVAVFCSRKQIVKTWQQS